MKKMTSQPKRRLPPKLRGNRRKFAGSEMKKGLAEKLVTGSFSFKFFCVNSCSSNGKESKPLRELGAHGPSPANEENPFQELGAYGSSP